MCIFAIYQVADNLTRSFINLLYRRDRCRDRCLRDRPRCGKVGRRKLVVVCIRTGQLGCRNGICRNCVIHDTNVLCKVIRPALRNAGAASRDRHDIRRNDSRNGKRSAVIDAIVSHASAYCGKRRAGSVIRRPTKRDFFLLNSPFCGQVDRRKSVIVVRVADRGDRSGVRQDRTAFKADVPCRNSVRTGIKAADCRGYAVALINVSDRQSHAVVITVVNDVTDIGNKRHLRAARIISRPS